MPPAPTFILTSQRVEPYSNIEIRIQAAITFIENGQNAYPNIAAIARTYEVPITRLRARLQGRPSRQEWPAANYRLSEDQELAVCQYLDRLDAIGTSARLQMVTSTANTILRNSHDSIGLAPIVDDHWAQRFLN